MRKRCCFLVLALMLSAGLSAPRAQEATVLSPSRAQEATVLTLEHALEIAQKNSPAVRMARLDIQRADLDFRAFRAGYLPSISLRGNTPGLLRSISDVQQDDGSVRYVQQSRTFSSIGLSVEQPLSMTGGRLFVSSGLSRIDLFGDFGSNQWQSSPLVVGLEQPIFRFNQLKWERQMEPLHHRTARRQHAEELAAVDVEITQRFFEAVIAQMDVERAAFNVAVNDTIYTLSEGRFEIGRIAENDLLQSELALLNAETELEDARIAYERAVRELQTALDLPYDSALQILPPFRAPSVEIDPADAVAHARRNRAAYLEMEIESLAALGDVRRTRARNGFSADVTASYGLNQSSEHLADAYTSPLNQQRFSVNFSVPLYHWGRSGAEIESARAEQRRVEESIALRRKEIDQDVYFEVRRLEQLRRRLETSAKADTIAARRFEVARNRYTIGKIDITELFIAQQAKDAANQAYIRTLQQFWTAYFRLRQITLFDFEAGVPLVRR